MREDGESRIRQVLQHAAAEAASSALTRPPPSSRRQMQPGGFPYGHHNFYEYYYGYGYPFYPEDDKFIGIIPWTMKILRILFIGLLLFCSSIIMYGCFYIVVMPGNHASRPLFFDYTGTVVYPHMDALIMETAGHDDDDDDNNKSHSIILNHKWWKKWKKDKSSEIALSTSSSHSETGSSSSNCPFTPWATVDLFSREQAVTLGETMNSELIPPQTINDRVLQPKQAYYVEVHLKLPESDLNRNLGMFGVAVDLFSYSSANYTSSLLASSVRPARLPHESSWVGVARKLLWLLPLIFGGVDESRVVIVPAFRHIVESQDHPLRHVVVRLVGQPSGWNGPNQPLKQPVEVIGGEVRIGKELNDFQQMLKDWFYTCYAIGTILLFGMHVGAYTLVQYYRRDVMEGFEGAYVDQACVFDEMGEQDNDDFESVGADDNIHPDDEDHDDNNDSLGFDQSPSSGFAEYNRDEQDDASDADNDNNDDHYYAGDDHSDDWEDLTAMHACDIGRYDQTEGDAIVEPLDSQVDPKPPSQHASPSFNAYFGSSRPQEPEFNNTLKAARASPRNGNQKSSISTNQWDKREQKLQPTSFLAGTVQLRDGRSTKSNTSAFLSKDKMTPQDMHMDINKELHDMPSSANQLPTDVQPADSFFDCLDGADAGSYGLGKDENMFFDPSRGDMPSDHASFRSQAMGTDKGCYTETNLIGAESEWAEMFSGIESPRSIAFTTKSIGSRSRRAHKIGPRTETKTQCDLRNNFPAGSAKADTNSEEKRKIEHDEKPLVEGVPTDAAMSKNPSSGSGEDYSAISIMGQRLNETEGNLEKSSCQKDDNDDLQAKNIKISIGRKPANSLMLTEPAHRHQDALRMQVPVQKQYSICSDDSIASFCGSWEELNVATRKAGPAENMAWIDSDEKALEMLPKKPTPMITKPYKTSRVAAVEKKNNEHENIFFEMGKLDEAQICDSFLHDLINPFVR